MTRIGFLHTAELHVDTFTGLLAAADGDAHGVHVVDESLLADARARGIDDDLRDRILRRLRSLAADVDAVLCTCSTISGPAEAMSADVGVPVIRIDRPVAALAVAGGGRIAVVAAVESTLAPTLALLHEEARARGIDVDLDVRPCLDAWAHFERGDVDAYLDAVAAHVDAIAPDVDVVVLAQASMAGAAERCRTGRPVLASPGLGVAAVVAAASGTITR
ncbi:MAG TPA: aspartate/glutamate racemase family protein [Acidimicrobiales bacterium]|nr:aspartate/glutamate racemase family protein [Acidimicrobiales bacterium]